MKTIARMTSTETPRPTLVTFRNEQNEPEKKLIARARRFIDFAASVA